MTALVEEDPTSTSTFKRYIFFWSGQLISILGSIIVQFIIIWWITIRTQSALYLSLANIAGFLPFIILTPLAGVFVDRWNRKILIGLADFLQAIVTIGLIFFFMYENTIFKYPSFLFKFNISSYILKYERVNNGPIIFVWIVLVFLAVRGCLQAFQAPAIQAIIPIMVPRKYLNRMNSVDFLFNGVMGLIGPVVAALLLAIPNVEIGNLLWIDAGTFLVAVIPLVLIKIPSITKAEKKEKKDTTFFQEFKEGIIFIKEKKGLLSLLGVFTGANLFLTPLFTLLNLYVYAGHGGNASNLALVMAFFQGGMIGASVLMVIWKGFKKKVLGVVLGLLVDYVGFIIIASTPTGWFWFMAIGMLITGFSLPVINLSSQYIWQTVVPNEKLGRVMAVRQTLAQFSTPLGMILAGVIANAANAIRPVFWGSIVLGVLLLAVSWFLTNLRHVEKGIYQLETKEEILPVETGLISSAAPASDYRES